MRVSAFVTVSTIATALSAVSAISCASSNDDLDAVRRATSAAYEGSPSEVDSDTASAEPQPDEVNTSPLYFDVERRVALGTSGTWQFTFNAHGGHAVRVALLRGSKGLHATLYGRDSLSPEWIALQSVKGAETAVTDTPKSEHAYRVDVTGPAASVVSLRLTCDAESHGACAVKRQPGDVCGGFAIGLTKCDGGLFCNMVKDTCGYADQGGRCEEPPEVCTMIWKPVCGCDGKTYGCACMAASALMSVAHDGTCPAKDNP